jgi:ETC complex I subunit-like protein
MKLTSRQVRIYKPAQTAMQSGMAGTKQWVMKFVPSERPTVDPVMGWIGSGDMSKQVKLTFATKEAAVAYAKKHDLLYEVMEPKLPTVKVKSYANNFAAR